MTTSVMQSTIPSPASGQVPRFRPFTSPSHHVTKGRYITSNDPRGYIPVYEYPLNGQWIMMDMDDGYILWTGIWKALGNSKADIVKMVDSQPELANQIRRVRGGYLKIQGTWMPYEVALRLARRVAYPIRDDLVPLFGPTFPSTCLSPDQPGYGQIVATGTGRRRVRRSNTSSGIPSGVSHESQSNWTVVTPTSAASGHMSSVDNQAAPRSSSGVRPPHSGDSQDLYLRQAYAPSPFPAFHGRRASGDWSGGSPSTISPLIRERAYRPRYAPYPDPSSSVSRKSSASSRGSISLDVPAMDRLSNDTGTDSQQGSPDPQVTLAPIHPSRIYTGARQVSYNLPPISHLEEGGGLQRQDSADVLRRLKLDDDSQSSSEGSQCVDEQPWARDRSFSTPPYKMSPSNASGGPSYRRDEHRPPYSSSFGRQPSSHLMPPELSLSVPSFIRDDTSTCDPSPVSPATPRSAVADERPGLVPLSVLQDTGRMKAPTGTGFPGAPLTRDWLHSSVYPSISRRDVVVHGTETRLSACRHSCDDAEDGVNDAPMYPARPWS